MGSLDSALASLESQLGGALPRPEDRRAAPWRPADDGRTEAQKLGW
jgi:hypothetical protein